MSAAPPALPAMDNTMGALLIGAFISCMLLGLTTVQLYLYAGRFPNDAWWTKAFVFGIWVIDTLQTAFQCHALYFYLVTHYADPTVLAVGIWSLDTMSLLEAFIGGPVEIFFAMRIWKLSDGAWYGKVITVIVVILSILHSCLGIAFSARTFSMDHFASWGSLQWDTTTGLSAAAAADIIIAVTLVCLLRARASNSVFSSSKSLVNSLILYTVETGVITSIWALVVIITFATMPTNLIAVGMLFILPKLYANSLMAMLNSRSTLRNGNQSVGAMQLTSHHTHKGANTSMPLLVQSTTVTQTDSGGVVDIYPYKSENFDTFSTAGEQNV